LVDRVATQVEQLNANQFVYFTKRLAQHPAIVPYHDVLAGVCRRLSRRLCVVEFEEAEMGVWRELMQAADKAKVRMIGDRANGEKEFGGLLATHPDDGMLYFKRGEAYEALGENKLAAGDFRRAMALFPKADWKARAKEAIDRLGG